MKNKITLPEFVTIKDLEELGFTGPVTDVGMSVLDCRMAWAEEENDWFFIFPATHGKGWDWGRVSKDTDPVKEWGWVDWDGVNSYRRCKLDDSTPLPEVVFELADFYGPENVFGTTYHDGFIIYQPIS